MLKPVRRIPGPDAAEPTPTQARILSALSLNARAPYSEIAEQLGVSRQAVKYNHDLLLNRGIIESHYALLNIVKLGLLYHRVFLHVANISPAAERKLIDYFRGHPNVGWVVEQDGPWDLALAVWTRSMTAFESVLDDMMFKMGRQVDEKRVSYSARIYHLKHKFLTQETNLDALEVGGELAQVALDDTDYEVLGVLTQAGRKSFSEIGAQLGISPKVVEYRTRRMLDLGVILGFNVKLNHGRLGYTHHKILLELSYASKPKIAQLIRHLKQLTSTVCITRSIGFSDLEFELMVRSNAEFNAVMKDLRYTFPDLIQNYTSFIILKETYINYLPDKVEAFPIHKIYQEK